jgi:alpha-glucosidase (family GH31 glycosyl hydrolase)
MICCGTADRFPAPKMRAFVDKLHKAGQHWVPIHDAAISKQPGYKAYEEGSRANVWIKDMHGDTYVGQVRSFSQPGTWTGLEHYGRVF